MKALVTTDCVGGVWTYALELCDALAVRGVETVLVCMGRPLSAAQRGPPRRRNWTQSPGTWVGDGPPDGSKTWLSMPMCTWFKVPSIWPRR